MLLRNRKRIRRDAGYSMLEVIFAVSIITTSILGSFAALKYLNSYVARRKEFSREANLAMTVIATVAANPGMFPPGDEFFGARDDGPGGTGDVIIPDGIAKPYYAFGPYYFGPASECPECPNRIGVVTQSVPLSPRSLFVRVVIMTVRKESRGVAAASGKITYSKTKEYKSLVSF